MSGISRQVRVHSVWQILLFTRRGRLWSHIILCEGNVIQMECLTWSLSLRKVTFLSTEWAARTFPSETFLKPSSCRMSSSVTTELQISLQTQLRLEGYAKRLFEISPSQTRLNTPLFLFQSRCDIITCYSLINSCLNKCLHWELITFEGNCTICFKI